MGLGNLIHSSGGLRYHLRARRYGKKIWPSFHHEIHLWLEEWNPNPRHPLILVGPSAGYSLSPQWLERFPEVIVMDPDPLARLLFRRKFLKIRTQRIHWKDVKLFHDGPDYAQTRRLLEGLPAGASILFCNVLGQISLDAPSMTLLKRAVTDRSWASFHDRYSVDWDESSHRQVELQDHLDLTSLASSCVSYFVWDLTPQRRHLIQAIAV